MRHRRGTAAFRRTMLALFSAGFSTFWLMYCTQPLLPAFAREFHLSAAASSLAVSMTTGTLAVAMLGTGALSEGWGRKPLMVASLLAAAVLTVVSAAATSWPVFLLFRAVEGVAFAGVPAIAMAYVGEEIEASSVGVAMGLYVAGTALGGMAGRLLTSVLVDSTTWRLAVATVGAIGLFAAVVVWALLPASSHFRSGSMTPSAVFDSYTASLRDRLLAILFAQGFLFMGSFVAMYNYIGFRLVQPPYSLSQSHVGFLFILYLLGMISSPWAGSLMSRIGPGRTLRISLALMLGGVVVTMLTPLWTVATGMGLFTVGFFAAHSVVSSWIGFRSDQRKAQAASLYLFFYYLGASIAGSAGGLFWAAGGWTGVALLLVVLLVTALALTTGLASPESARHGRVPAMAPSHLP